MHQLIEKFKALGDETRFKIFLLLAKNQICVKGLANVLEISESAVSQHLKILKNSGLIKGEKKGYFMHYKVQKNVIKELEGIICELAKDTVDITKISNELNVNEFDCTHVACKKLEECNES